jgi:hypothetical protein
MVPVLEWLTEDVERETTERPWPSLDVRARYYNKLHDPDHDPSQIFWLLYKAVELPLIQRGLEAGKVDWSEAYYTQTQTTWPPQPCPRCGSGDARVTVGRFIHGAAWQACPQYELDTMGRRCPHGSNGSVQPGDAYGCLTACCGAAWSINDGPPYCKCCYAEIDTSYERHEIYEMWEAPDLAHYAKRIEAI